MPHLPERIHRLDDLARNVWWSWTPDARTVFRTLDYTLWRSTAHNPMLMIRAATAEMLAAAMANPAWLAATAAAGMPKFETMLPYFPKNSDITGVGTITQMLLAKGTDVKTIEQVRRLWDGPLLVKGVMSVADAKLARSVGQPVDFYAEAEAFSKRLDKDVEDKARLLKALGELK